MKRTFTVVALVMVLMSTMALAQTTTVHFRINTAAIPDTMNANSVVQLRGSEAPLTWDGNSGVRLQNVGGDYWEGTADFPTGAIVQYKVYTNASHDTVYGGASWEHEGWEANTNDASGNRILDLTTAGADTTVPLQFANGWNDGAGQYDTPYTTNDSTFVVYLRVNVQGFAQQGFDPSQHKIGVRGSNTSDWGQTGELGWNSTFFLTPENDHANGGSQQYQGSNFWSGAIHFPAQYANSGIQWKFVTHFNNSPADDDWGNMFWNPAQETNVQFSGSGADTTLAWLWYDNFRPGTASLGDTVEVTYKADMSDAIAGSGFTPGDTVIAISGWNLTGAEIYRTTRLVKQGFTNVYAATDTVVTAIGSNLQYNYYIIKDGIEYREIFFDFTDTQGGSSPEKRKLQITGNTVEVVDDAADVTSLRRKPKFRNLANLNDSTTVTYAVDLRPAWYQVAVGGDTLVDIQGAFDVTDADSVFAWGIRINGPATGGWGAWGIALFDDSTRTMFDDGTHGDEVAGDSIFSQTFGYNTSDIVGQEFKFGVRGGDNEGGFGNNHIQNIDQSAAHTYIHDQFGSIDPLFYWTWDYTNGAPSAIGDNDVELPTRFALHQNYPNPFNPTTNIKFDIPEQSDVTLKIFNVLGQKVATVFNGNLKAGEYAMSWNGRDNVGNLAASGVYFFKLEAGQNSAVRKMVLMK